MPARRGLVLLGSALVLALAVSGCASGSGKSSSSSTDAGGDQSAASAPKKSTAKITANIHPGASNVRVDRTLKLTVADGTFSGVAVKSNGAPLAGALSADKRSWVATGRLQPAQSYQVHGVAEDSDGATKAYDASFATQRLSLDQQTFPSFSPVANETVGVGMPVIIKFDVAVTNKAAIERHLKVISTPVQTGAFHWVSDTEVHWRPQTYWKAGTNVTVRADIDSVPAGNGVYGQKNRQMTFHVGRSMRSVVNTQTHQMKVFRDGKLIRTIPITTGKPGFTTRSGVKVIVEKFRSKTMNSETIGIDPNSADGYNLDNVEYAMRVTYSGEFLHAAPWSVGSQGHANVSHGCTGMSTDNARWLYDNSIRGDVVEYTGTDKQMTLTNGFGDWNEPFATYASGSAVKG